MNVSSVILLLVSIYLVAGLLFAFFFVFRLVDEFDEEAKGAPLLFRLLILPGSVLLWPYLLRRHLQNKRS